MCVCLCVFCVLTRRGRHTTHPDFLTLKPLFAAADSCVDMDRNGNELAACVKSAFCEFLL